MPSSVVRFLAVIVVILGLVSAVPTAGSADRAVPRVTAAPVVGSDVAAAVQREPQVVVVALDVPEAAGGGASRRAVEAIARMQDTIVASLPPRSVDRVLTFEHVPAMAMVINDRAAIDVLASMPGVRRVDLDVGGTGALSDAVTLTDAGDRHAVSNRGEGVVVAVIDSGVDSDHPDLVGDVVPAAQACFGFDSSAPGVGFCPDGSDSQTGAGSAEDDVGHGTHVAGIVSSDGVDAAPGFAPDADIVALKALGAGPGCSAGCFSSFTLNIVAALDHLIANPQLGVEVVNMSLGTNATFVGDCDTATAWTIAGASAIATLRSNGVIAFASAGNDGLTTQMGAPACLSNVISVGASDDLDQPAPFSNVATTTDLFGPGVGIVSSALGGGTVSFSGTSMASPAAAGCAALLIESGDATTPAEIETRLEASATTVLAANGTTYPRFDCGVDSTTLRLLDSACTALSTDSVIGGGSTDFSVTSCVPAAAESVVANVIVEDPIAAGNLRLSPFGVAPLGGIVNFAANGLDNSNAQSVPLSASQQLSLSVNGGPFGVGQVLAAGARVEILGWYGPPGDGGLRYGALPPCAFFDTRFGTGLFAGPFDATRAFDVDVSGTLPVAQGGGNADCGVPDGVAAALVNIVLVNSTGPVAITTTGTGASAVSNIAHSPLMNNSSAVVVPVNEDGAIELGLTVDGGDTHVRGVVLGYYDDPTSGALADPPSLEFLPLPPCPVFDTRPGEGAADSFAGPRLGDQTTVYVVAGTFDSAQGGGAGDCGVPLGAGAVEINLVAVNSIRPGNLRASAFGDPPTGGVLNFADLSQPMNNSNAIVLPISADGRIEVTVNGGPTGGGLPVTQIRGVVSGYYVSD